MKIQNRKTSDLIPYVNNPRKNDHAVDRLASAIREFGFKIPIIIKSDNSVIDGHLRLKAAQKLGLETVPVVIADDLTETQIKAFRLSVNKMAELAEWDTELLELELDFLKEADFDIDLTGFEIQDPTEGEDFEFDPKDKSDKDDVRLSIKVTLETLEQQEELFAELVERGFKVAAVA